MSIDEILPWLEKVVTVSLRGGSKATGKLVGVSEGRYMLLPGAADYARGAVHEPFDALDLEKIELDSQ